MRLTKHIESLIRRNRNSDENWYTYLFFVVLRIVLVFIPQLGYVHPDEFFQSTEVFVGEYFGLEHVRAWEFNNTMPIRSVTIPYFLLRMPLNFLEIFANSVKEFFGLHILSSYTYLIFPRLTMCCLSFVNDWCMYRVCSLYSLRHEIRLLALSSSYVMLIFGTRTFSNSIEMAITSVLLYLTSECMIRSNTIIYKKEFLEERYDKADSIGEKVRIWKLKNALPEHNYSRLVLMSSVCVAGVFNRPTFLLFGAPMVFYWLTRGMGTKTISFTDFNCRIFLFCLSAVPAICFFIFVDSLYYKHLILSEIHMGHVSINNFIFTPWNFIKYNIDPNKTAEHGLHPRYIHLLVNIPLLYNILGVIALVSFAYIMIRFFKAEYQGLPRVQSLVGLMSSAIFAPLFFMSLINHQEARFLIPFTFPIILLHSPKLVTGFCTVYPFKEEHKYLQIFYESVLCTKASAKCILKTWYTINIALVIFFGFIHQAGVFPLSQHFESALRTKALGEHLHLITSHTYNMPVTFVNIPSSSILHTNRATGQKYRRNKDFYLYEYGGLVLDKLLLKIRIILSNCETKLKTKRVPYRLFLAIPSTLSDDLNIAANKMNNTDLNYYLEKIFYPHLSTEALPNLLGKHPCDVHPLYKKVDNMVETCNSTGVHYLSTTFLIKQFSSVMHQFGLILYRFELNSKRKHVKS